MAAMWPEIITQTEAATRPETATRPRVFAQANTISQTNDATQPKTATRHEALINRAVEAGLHERPQWQTLLHYRPTLTRGVRSIVDDPAFFISSNGKTSPADELGSTIMAFFTDTSPGNSHPLCRFPARHAWLVDVLAIAPGTLPSPECSELEEYIRKVNPLHAALVFPESYINSPASMFGHTLIRLDSDNQSSLLSWSVSFAAKLPDDPGPLYALRGVMGGYRGYFTALPYYEKIKEYTSMESRDIWEYRLALSEDEVMRMALHVWELRDIYIDYYFFDDNCAYMPLLLIEAARPRANLSGGLSYMVLPIDTIRALKSNGLINQGEFRPSKATGIALMESLSPEPVLDLALRLADGSAEPGEALESRAINDRDRALSLDLATEYIQHLYLMGSIERDAYSKRFLGLLAQRSRLPEPTGVTAPRKGSGSLERSGPLEGHDSMRLSIGAGREGDENYALIRWRLTYHGLMDPEAGYKQGAAIEALEVEARHFYDDTGTENTVLQKLTLFEITSLAPRGNFIKPVSWRMRLGAEREVTHTGDRTPVVLEGGAGMSTIIDMGTSMGSRGIGYILIEPSLKAGGALRQNYSLGGGLSGGAMFVSTDSNYKAMLNLRALYYPAGDRHGSQSIALRQSAGLGQNVAIALDAVRRKVDGHYYNDISLGLNVYF